MRNSPDRLPPLDLLAAFEAAARQLSFTRAAAERFITQSAMSRQIQQLEQHLGVALFKRRHRALSLTEPGLRLHATCTTVLEQLRGTLRDIRAPARREVLALTTTPGFAAFWLIPRLASFTRAHPGIDVRLDTSYERRDLRADEFDLAIRYGRVGASEGTPMFAEAVQPVCSPALLRPPNAALKTPRDLRSHTLLQMTNPTGIGMPLEWESWLQAAGLPGLEPAATLSFSGYGDAIAAAQAGQGVALGRRPLIDALLRSRKLVAPFKDATATTRAYFLVVQAAARSRPAVRALEQWLLEQAGQPSADPL